MRVAVLVAACPFTERVVVLTAVLVSFVEVVRTAVLLPVEEVAVFGLYVVEFTLLPVLLSTPAFLSTVVPRAVEDLTE